MDFSNQISGPPQGPDLTFLCTKVEQREMFKDNLNENQYDELMQIHNGIWLEALRCFNGHCIEQNEFNLFTVFGDVYDGIRCAINIQKNLNSYNWPNYLYEVELKLNMNSLYIGKGNKSFNGVRVGMGLHTATTGQSINKYDGGYETLKVEQIIFDATYKGTAVDLVKALCVQSYGGELLGTKAVKEALLRSKK